MTQFTSSGHGRIASLFVLAFFLPVADAQTFGHANRADARHDDRVSLDEADGSANWRQMSAGGPSGQPALEGSPASRWQGHFNGQGGGHAGNNARNGRNGERLDRDDWNTF